MKQRFEKLRVLLTEKLTLYPILTGILFLVNELRNNAIFYTLQENVSLILIILAFTFVIDFLSRKLIRNKTKAALIASSFIIINLFYQDIFLFLTNQRSLISFDKLASIRDPVILIIPVIILLWLTFTILVLRIKRNIAFLNLYLNVILVAFIFIEIAKLFIVPITQIKLADNKPFPVNIELSTEQKPNIYYLLLDSYTSSESLKKYWKYDNSGFEDSLKHLGFQISSKSKSDFASTPYCLASYLNSSPLLIDTTKYHYNERNSVQLIRNNRLSNWLIANNYYCLNFSLFDAFETKRYYNYFTYNHFLGRTLWYVNIIKLNHFINPSSSISNTNLKIFNKLNNLSKVRHDQPSFTYAHVMMPHYPFTFNEQGKPFKSADSLTDKQKYLAQLIYTNSLTLEVINHILLSSQRKPIIIIQGDHGFRYLEDTSPIEKSREAHTIFYAIYLPKGIMIPDTIKPTNTFKWIIERINHYEFQELGI